MMIVQRKNSEGQALVLVLLSLAVVLTIVLYIISRSITDISVSTSENQAVSAFSAAEAGVEQALVIGAGGSSTVGSATYNSQVTGVGSGLANFIYPVESNSGDSVTLWLKSQDTSPNFTGTKVKICWGKSGSASSLATTPAIETVLFYGTTPATTKISRSTSDPNTLRTATNSFSASGGSCTISGQTFPFQTTLDLTGLTSPQFIFVKMFYNTDSTQPVGFDSTNANLFPSQGILVDSTGQSGQSARKVQVYQSWPEIPSLFQFAIVNPNGLAK